MTKNFKKNLINLKIIKFFQKIDNVSDIKHLKTIPSQIKFFQLLIIKPSRWFSGPCVWKDVNIEKRMNKIEKIAIFQKKLLKFVVLKFGNHSTTTRNYAVTYYQTPEEFPWHLGLIKLKK